MQRLLLCISLFLLTGFSQPLSGKNVSTDNALIGEWIFDKQATLASMMNTGIVQKDIERFAAIFKPVELKISQGTYTSITSGRTSTMSYSLVAKPGDCYDVTFENPKPRKPFTVEICANSEQLYLPSANGTTEVFRRKL